MNKGGGLGSMVKGMGGKLNKLKDIKDKTVKVSSQMADKAGDISNKVSEIKGKAQNLESSIKDKTGLSDKKTEAKIGLLKGLSNVNKFDEGVSSKQSKEVIRSQLLDGQSVVNKYEIFGPGTYKYLIYIILFLNICSIFLLTFNKSIFYKYQGNVEVDVRLNKNVFYIYIFTLFLLILQIYTLQKNYNAIVERRGKYQVYVEGFNVLCTIGLSYYIYKQVDFIHTDCPEPNKEVCVANKMDLMKFVNVFYIMVLFSTEILILNRI